MASEWDVAKETPLSEWEPVSEEPIKPGPSRADYYINQGKKAVSGGIGMAGLPVDVVNSRAFTGPFPANAIGIANLIRQKMTGETGEYPFMGSQNIREGIDSLIGTQDIEAPTKLDKIPGLAIELGGPSIPLMVRNIMKAPHKIPAVAAEIGSLFGGATGGVVGGELGAEMDQEFGTDFGRAVGEAVGMLTGSVVPTVTPTVGSKLYGMAKSKVSPAAHKEAAERGASKILGPAMESELGVEKNIALADEVTGELKKHGNFEPTIGARTNAQVVRELESGVASSSPERLSRYAQRRGQNEATLARATDETMGAEKATNLPRQAQSRLNAANRSIEERLAQLEKQQKANASSTEGRLSQEVGEEARDQYWKKREDVKGEFKRAYNELYDATDKTSVDMSDVSDAVKRIAGADENVYQDMPRTFGKIRDQMGGEVKLPYPKPANVLQESANERAIQEAKEKGSKTTFREFHSLWKEVSKEHRIAKRQGDTKRMGYLDELKKTLDAKLDSMEAGGLGEFSDEFRVINQNYKTRYAKVFKEGIGGRIADVGKFGATMDDAKVVERFFTPDGMDDFTAIYGSDANANQLLKDGILGLFAKNSIDEVTGKLKPGAAESFLRRNAEALKKVPEVDAMLRNTVQRNEALVERQSRLRKAQQQIDHSILKDVSKAEDVGALIRKSAKSPKEMRRLFAISRTPQQRKALARSLADELPKIAEEAGMEPYAYLMKNEGTFKPILTMIGPKHWKNLRIIAGGQTLVKRQDIPGRVNVKKGQDPLFEATGSNARSLVATYLSVLRGRTQPHSELSQIFARFGIKRHEKLIDEIMNEAIYDPEMADAIVKIRKGKANDVVANKFKHYLETAAFRTATSAVGEEEKDSSE